MEGAVGSGVAVAVGSGVFVGSRVAAAVGAGVTVGDRVGVGVGSDSHAASVTTSDAIIRAAAQVQNLLLIKLLAYQLPARRYRRPAMREESPFARHKHCLPSPLQAQIGQANFNSATCAPV